MVGFEALTDATAPEAVAVGGVKFTVGCAPVGAKAGVPDVLVEAGLRSRGEPRVSDNAH